MSTFEIHGKDWLTAEDMEVYKYSSERIIAVQNVKLGNSPASA